MKPKRDSCGILNQIVRFTAIFFEALGETSVSVGKKRRWAGSWTRICSVLS